MGNARKSDLHSNKVKPTESANTADSETVVTPLFIVNMIFRLGVVILLIAAILYYPASSQNTLDQEASALSNDGSEEGLYPTVFVSLLIRNKAHALPYVLHHLALQDYPKDRMTLRLHVDNSIDDSADIAEAWVDLHRQDYRSIDVTVDAEFQPNVTDTYWSAPHFSHLMRLRQNMLDEARDASMDYFFSLDMDVVLLEPKFLRIMVRTSEANEEVNLLGPMLNCSDSTVYGNFWGAMSAAGYYARSSDYFDLYNRRKEGIFPVALVHSAFLINLARPVTRDLTVYPFSEDYDGPIDDLVVFARLAKETGVRFWLDNRQVYGYFHTPPADSDLDEFDSGTYVERSLMRNWELFQHLRLQVMLNTENEHTVDFDQGLASWVEKMRPKRNKLGFDEVYVVNLERRVERRKRMEHCLDEFNVEWTWFQAIDGRKLTANKLNQLGVNQLPGYADPYHHRALKFGEIGCFLSHYQIWLDMLEKNHTRILILEDDIRFTAGFLRAMSDSLQDADRTVPDWELLYFGRKRMSKKEKLVAGSKRLTYPDYTYWTLGYAVRQAAVRKFLAQKPLSKMVAVDEFIPIMFDRHPNKDWLVQFEPRDLLAISTEPLLVEPTHYTGEPMYFSDTEDSLVIDAK